MKKNIAFVIYSLNSGGAERVVSTLANGLADKHNITIITLINDKPFYFINDRVNIVACKSSSKKSISFLASLKTNYQLYLSIKKISISHSINLLIGFMTTTNILTILVAKSLNIPVIISERIYPSFAKLSNFWRVMRRLTYPKANMLVVQTEPIMQYFKSFLPTEKLQILANPISSKHSEVRNNLQVQKENIILNVGRLTYQKGQDLAIKAFAQINPANWKLHLVGDGPKKNEYSNLISELGMNDKIELVGPNNQISQYYLKAQIFIFPSRYEGFPNALTEAMYMGLPSISSDCPTGPSELIKNGNNGFLIPVDNIEHLVSKLNLLMNDVTLRQKMGQKAADSVKHLEESKVVEKWSKLIYEMLKG